MQPPPVSGFGGSHCYSPPTVPLAYPENVGVEILNSTSVRVRWSLAGTPQDLRGHLRGYRVRGGGWNLGRGGVCRGGGGLWGL